MPPKVNATTVIVKPANTTNTTAVSNITNATSTTPTWNDTQVGEKFFLEVISGSRLRLLFTSKANLSLNGTVRNLKSVDIVTLLNQSVYVAGNQTIVLPNMTSYTYSLLAYIKGLIVLPVNQSYQSVV